MFKGLPLTLRLLTLAAIFTANVLASGRVVTVTTANNLNPPAGTVSLLQALTSLQAGDTIPNLVAAFGAPRDHRLTAGAPLY